MIQGIHVRAVIIIIIIIIIIADRWHSANQLVRRKWSHVVSCDLVAAQVVARVDL